MPDPSSDEEVRGSFPVIHPSHDDFKTRHAPLPIELPLDDDEGSTSVDVKTQIVRFIATGALSAVFDFGLTLLLQTVVGAPFWLAKAAGFILGTTIAYLINRRWTFRAEPSKARFLAVVALYAVTFFVNVGLYNWLMHEWGTAFGYVALAFCIAQGVATVINFVVQRAVIFKIR
ncbi:MAG: GtrA family protein [Gordonia sp. (in: high G+C Gram-positive bacteria)]|uniref:GtrA family protein n=1 Tax=Gordonia sp. (in: high G+C Gram-positive bacteria) TaxID=84139 RepID=UPI003C747FEA